MRVKDLSRRELLKLFGVTVGGSLVGSAGFPLNVQAQSKKVTPRKNVRNVVFFQNCGAMSPPECLDFHESKFTAKDLNLENVNGNKDFQISRTIFPFSVKRQLTSSSSGINKRCIWKLTARARV